jgi:folate-binding protein YgfZ
MNGIFYSKLGNRGLLRVKGSDSRNFLQNLITNDINKVATNKAIFGALLTPQGKFLHEFIIIEGSNGEFLLDCETERLNDLGRVLINYRLRSDVQISDMRDEIEVYALTHEPILAETKFVDSKPMTVPHAIVFDDPREKALGQRIILPITEAEKLLEVAGYLPAAQDYYEQLRLQLGIPDGSRDIEVGKSTLAEAGFERLNGIDFSKGCYIGQEVTTRMKQRGTARKKLIVVRVSGSSMPPYGTPIYAGEKQVGEIKSGSGQLAMALIRREYTDESKSLTLTANNSPISFYLE